MRKTKGIGPYPLMEFSVCALSSKHCQRLLRVQNVVADIWKTKAPARGLTFGWLALRGKTLAMDNLQRRKMIVVNTCPMSG